ncbi:MAG: glycosyltransferase [Victivallales bacterium]|nr:glycosyltransferase [Victivallales bacterium]
MKTLLLHYWLINDRGGEKVLKIFADMFKNADILTHVYDPDKFQDTFRTHQIRRTFIDALPMARKNYQKYLPLMPLALKLTNVSEYDFLLSSESGPIKGVKKASGAMHVCYCHTPMRYVWDMYEQYRDNSGYITRGAMSLFHRYLQNYDLKSAEQVDHFIANSAFVAERIKRIYKRNSTVIHPPVNVAYYSRQPRMEKDFFLYAGELCRYKRPDIVVEAFRKNRRRLIVAGCGNELETLRKQASDSSNIEFHGRVSDDELRNLYRSCRALIFPGLEDFGIIPLEAQAAGAPVVAYGAGGALETVMDNKTGLLFGEQTATALLETLENFDAMSFETEVIRSHASGFSETHFSRRLHDFLLQCNPSLPLTQKA